MAAPASFDFGPYGMHLGFTCTDVQDDLLEIRMETEPHHMNKAGVIHGGILFALGDTAMGAAVHTIDNPGADTFLSTDVHIRYVRPFFGGPLIARGRFTAKTGRTRVMSCEITDEHGKILATLTAQFRLREKK